MERRLNYLHYLEGSNNGEMLHKVFKEQWDNLVEGDWTVKVKNYMKLFGIEAQTVRGLKRNAYKEYVKKKGKDFEFEKLIREKNTKKKLENLNYVGLKIQNYLENQNVTTEQALAVFSFRTRMVPCSMNYKQVNVSRDCLWCGEHEDSQELMFICKFLKSVLEITGNYMDVFGEIIESPLTNTLMRLWSYRRENRKWTNW